MTRQATAALIALSAGVLHAWPTVPAVGRGTQSQTGAKPELPYTAAELAERTHHRSAVEAVIWGMPAVNFARQASRGGSIPSDGDQG